MQTEEERREAEMRSIARMTGVEPPTKAIKPVDKTKKRTTKKAAK